MNEDTQMAGLAEIAMLRERLMSKEKEMDELSRYKSELRVISLFLSPSLSFSLRMSEEAVDQYTLCKRKKFPFMVCLPSMCGCVRGC